MAAEQAPCNERCDAYPVYGPCPHICFYKLQTPLGTSQPLPRDQWPDNFVVDPETEHDGDGMPCGVHYCPDCKRGMPAQNQTAPPD